MIEWRVTRVSTWSKTELGFVGNFHIATIESIFETRHQNIVNSVTVTFLIGNKAVRFEAPSWYVSPDMVCELYHYQIAKHHEKKKRFDNFSSGNYTECYEWVQAHLDTFLVEANLHHGGFCNKA